MNETGMEIDWRAVAFYLWGAIVTVLGAFGLHVWRKGEKNAEDIAALRSAVVPKTEWDEFKEQHQNKMDELRMSLTATVNMAVDRVEKGNKAVIDQVSKTQETILNHLLGGKNAR